jgi:hypothetical protein
VAVATAALTSPAAAGVVADVAGVAAAAPNEKLDPVPVPAVVVLADSAEVLVVPEVAASAGTATPKEKEAAGPLPAAVAVAAGTALKAVAGVAAGGAATTSDSTSGRCCFCAISAFRCSSCFEKASRLAYRGRENKWRTSHQHHDTITTER